MIQFSFYLGSAGHRPSSVSCGLTCETLAISQLPPTCSAWPIEDRVHPHIGLRIMSTRHCPCLCSPRGRTRRLLLLICPISDCRRLFAPYSTVTIRFRPLRIDLLFICLFVESVPFSVCPLILLTWLPLSAPSFFYAVDWQVVVIVSSISFLENSSLCTSGI